MDQRRARFVVAVHLFLVREGSVLLLRRRNTGFADGSYSVVAGHLDGGEQVVAGTVREAREEVGITLDPADLHVVGVVHRLADDERIDFFLAAETWRGQIRNAEPGKCDEIAWFPLDRLPENLVPYVARALQNYRRGVWFDSFGWDVAADRPDEPPADH
jgi:ADP-ribose pyrophosphatase YjhB (NUDIX family)